MQLHLVSCKFANVGCGEKRTHKEIHEEDHEHRH